MGRIDRFQIGFIAGQNEHSPSNLVLSVGRQSAHRRKSLLKELGHPR
jgi:hypothetical protein